MGDGPASSSNEPTTFQLEMILSSPQRFALRESAIESAEIISRFREDANASFDLFFSFVWKNSNCHLPIEFSSFRLGIRIVIRNYSEIAASHREIYTDHRRDWILKY
jgi:hypothetical protein